MLCGIVMQFSTSEGCLGVLTCRVQCKNGLCQILCFVSTPIIDLNQTLIFPFLQPGYKDCKQFHSKHFNHPKTVKVSDNAGAEEVAWNHSIACVRMERSSSVTGCKEKNSLFHILPSLSITARCQHIRFGDGQMSMHVGFVLNIRFSLHRSSHEIRCVS